MATVEQWKPVAGHPGYEVSDHGRVRSLDRVVWRSNGTSVRLPGKVLRPLAQPNGYIAVALPGGKRRNIHRLVMLAFCEPDPERSMVNHKDGNKANARLSNLEWSNKSENAKHSYGALGQQPPLPRKPVVVGGVAYPSLLAAGKALAVSPGAIHSALGKGHRIKGMEVHRG